MEATFSGLTLGPFASAGLTTDIDGTVFFQLVMFLALIFILHKTLFKPYLAVRRERENLGTGTREEAARLEAEAEELVVSYEKAIRETREGGHKKRQVFLDEARVRETEILSAVREQTADRANQEKQKVAEEVERAREQLDNTARELSTLMVRQVLPS